MCVQKSFKHETYKNIIRITKNKWSFIINVSLLNNLTSSFVWLLDKKQFPEIRIEIADISGEQLSS